MQLSYTIATKAFAAPGYIAAFAALVILTLYAYRFKAALGCVRGSSCIPPYYVSAMIAIAVFPGVGFVRTIDGLIRITRSSVETLPMTLVSETIYYGANTAVTLAAMVFAIIITASFAEYRRDKRGVK